MAKENVKEDYCVGQALKKARYAKTELKWLYRCIIRANHFKVSFFINQN
jgi:hypothetical protein